MIGSTPRILIIAAASAIAMFLAGSALGQPDDALGANPLEVIDTAARSLPGFRGGLSGALNILVLLTLLTLAPAILVLCTCFTRIVIVLSLLRQALGTQNLPPSQVIVGLSLFITLVVMAPTAQRVYEDGIRPYAQGEITDYDIAWQRARQPVRDFMFSQIEASGNWSGVFMILNYRGVDTSAPDQITYADVDMLTLVPAFILSELKTAFLMGFKVYLPFLVIDLVISSLLISMGMLMLPPVLISLPFKLLLFVLVDGWQLVIGGLMLSVHQPDAVAGLDGGVAWLISLSGPYLGQLV